MIVVAWVLVGLAALYFGAIASVAVAARRDIEVLADLPVPELTHWPRLSVITPARDEAAGLEKALRSKLTSTYPALELVAVDDRSKDGTGAIIDALAAEDSRVRAVHVTELPAGWLGKLNALQRGKEAATGEWLLFTDADIHFTPDALTRAVGYVERRGLDFLAVFPDLWPSGVLVDAGITALMRSLSLGMRKRAAENPKSRMAVGGGVFNLVRRAALDRSAGLADLKMEVIDDIGLAQMIKRSGGKCSVANAQGLVGLHFYRSVGEMIRASEKNAYGAAGRFELKRLLPFVTLFFLLEWSPFWAIACGGALRWAGVGLLVLDYGGALAFTAWMRRPLLSALLTPVGATIGIWAALRAAYLTTLHGGISWRETFYSLEDLRKGRRFTIC